ncbi:hypothetical protein VP14_110 [Vibrio phage VPMCC14]|nr:hypothetical protein VP14_110 [Vibrio phage VPMCC14]
MKTRYATVDELILILQQLSLEGYGSAEVCCNGEYGVSLPTYEEEKPEIVEHKDKFYVNLGGYC